MVVNNGATYKVQASAIVNVSGVPTTRTITAGAGLTGGGDLSANRTISVAVGGIGYSELAASGVTPGTYGSSSELPIITVDQTGRVTSATTTAFSVSGYVPTTRQVIAGTGLSGGGALNANVTLNAVFSSATPLALGAATAGTADIAARQGHIHPAVNLASTVETTGVLGMVSGGTGVAHTSPAAGSIAYSDGSGIQLSTVGTLGLVLVSAGAAAPTWETLEVVIPQAANTVRAGPISGAAADPTYRALVAADIPSLSGTYIPYTGASAAINLNAQTVVNIDHLGVGTTTVPTILVRAVGDNNSNSRIAMRGYSSNANSSSMRVTKFRGSAGTPQAPLSGDSLGKFELAGYGTTSSDGYAQASFEGVATENWGAAARGAKTLIKVTPNTTTTQVTAVTVDQDSKATFAGAMAVTGHTTFEGVTSTGATGTGNLVYSASPTFTGTLTCATLVATTGISGGTF